MRRLPIYFLIDVSESMVGKPIEKVEMGIASIIKELRNDPYALETAFISILVFAGKAKQLIPLTEIYNFYPPKFSIGGGTSLGNALEFLMSDLDSFIQKGSYEQKGDWKPIIFLLTDGTPTDSVGKAFDKWNKEYRDKSNLIAISMGDNIDTSVLGKITENVYKLKDCSNETFKGFFKWISASIKSSSLSINELNDDTFKLPSSNNSNIEKINLLKDKADIIDENFAVFLGKCQNTQQKYLIKYAKRDTDCGISIEGLNWVYSEFKLVGAYEVDENYDLLSDTNPNNQKINTDELIGFPTCPCCGNQFGLVSCECGNIFCVGQEHNCKCPWCGSEGELSFSNEGMDLIRTRG